MVNMIISKCFEDKYDNINEPYQRK